MAKALRQRRTGMCSYAINACCFPLSSRRVASRLLRWAGLGALRPANQRAAAPPPPLSLLTQPLESRRRSVSAENEDGCYTVSSRVFSPVLWSQDPAHRRYEQLSLCVCVCVCALVCARALVWGQRRAALCLQATAAQRESFC